MLLRNFGIRAFKNLVWLLGLLLLQGSQAHAIIYYVSPSGNDANSGTSWATARTTIQAAMNLAHVSDQVWVAAGTYVVSSQITVNNGVALYGGFKGTEFTLGQRDFVHNVTIIDGNNTSSGLIFFPPNASIRSRVDGFTLQHASVCDIEVAFGSATVANNTMNEAGSQIISECIITYGGLQNNGTYYPNMVNIVNNVITSPATGMNISAATVSISGNMVQNCGSWGIFIASGLPAVTMNNNVVTDCGAGFYVNAVSLTFMHNSATFNAGVGMYLLMWYNRPDTSFMVADNISASNGDGGLSCTCNDTSLRGSQMIVKNNLIADNGSVTTGGGIFIDGTYGGFTLINNTIVDNAAGTATGGGGLYLQGTTGFSSLFSYTVANNLVAFNSSGIDTDGHPGPNLTLTTNDVYGSDFNNYDSLSPGATDISVDPLFVDRINQNYHAAAASPCIDAGTDSFVSVGDIDLDANPRIYGAHVDIGGYEWTPASYPALAALAISPLTLFSGQFAAGLVTLTSPALPAGAIVQLTNSNPAALTVPTSVTVTGGTTAALFTVTAAAVATPQTAVVAATYLGQTQSVTVTINPLIASLTLSPSVALGGASVTGTITLNGPAPTAFSVALSSSDPSVTVPASVPVAAGATFATFTATTKSVSAVKSVTLSAAYGVQTLNATLTVDPTATLKSLGIAPTAVTGSLAVTGVVTLTAAAPAGGITIPITSSDPSAASAPATVSIAAGKRSVSFLIITSVVTASSPVTFTAVLGAVTKTAKLTVAPATIASLTLIPSTVQGGENSFGIVTLTMPAPSAVIVTLSGTAIATPDLTTIVIPAGSIQAAFNISTTSVAAQTSATIKATVYGVAKTAALTVTP